MKELCKTNALDRKRVGGSEEKKRRRGLDLVTGGERRGCETIFSFRPGELAVGFFFL